MADQAERRRLYERHADVHPSFHDYEDKTIRVIPVIVLEREGRPSPRPDATLRGWMTTRS